MLLFQLGNLLFVLVLFVFSLLQVVSHLRKFFLKDLNFF